jgi:quinol monooxygenase YgiN
VAKAIGPYLLRVRFSEVFATKEDFEAHNNMPYVKEWFAKLPELADGGVRTTRPEIQPAADR